MAISDNKVQQAVRTFVSEQGKRKPNKRKGSSVLDSELKFENFEKDPFSANEDDHDCACIYYTELYKNSKQGEMQLCMLLFMSNVGTCRLYCGK